MNAARRTLGCWVLSAFLERGCDGTAARLPHAVWSVRSLGVAEAAALTPLAALNAMARSAAGGGGAIAALVPLGNLRRMPAANRTPRAASGGR